MSYIKDCLDFNPSFVKWNKKLEVMERIYYETSFYCNTNKIIHKNLKQKLNCKYCITDEIINEYGKDKFKELIDSL